MFVNTTVPYQDGKTGAGELSSNCSAVTESDP